MSPQVVLGLVFLFDGLLIAAVSLPLIASRVPRNRIYGFRTPKTLASDEVWYEANRFAGRQLFGAGLAQVMGALLLLIFARQLSPDVVALIGLALTLAPLGMALIRSFRFIVLCVVFDSAIRCGHESPLA